MELSTEILEQEEIELEHVISKKYLLDSIKQAKDMWEMGITWKF